MAKTETAAYIYALDETGNQINIEDAKRGANGYKCRFCGNEMVAKKGEIKVHHFAHKASCTCDPWYRGKGEWHRSMQNLFPKECQEVILENNGEKHIADVCLMKPCGQRLVIEFQKSSMSHEEFVKRTFFWKSNGADMIWVFNFEDKDILEFPQENEQFKGWYKWKRPSSVLGEEQINSTPIFFCIKPQINTFFYEGRGSNTWTYNGNVYKNMLIGWQQDARISRMVKACGYDNIRTRYVFSVEIPMDEIDRRNMERRVNRKRVIPKTYLSIDNYGLFIGDECPDFHTFVEERMQQRYDEPFVEFNEVKFWIAFPDVNTIREYVQTPNASLSGINEYQVTAVARKERMYKILTMRADSKSDLVKKLISKFGEDNVRVTKEKKK